MKRQKTYYFSTGEQTRARDLKFTYVLLWGQCLKRSNDLSDVKRFSGPSGCLIIIIIIIIIIIHKTIYIVLSSTARAYGRVHLGSFERKSVSAEWPPTRRPSCKLDF